MKSDPERRKGERRTVFHEMLVNAVTMKTVRKIWQNDRRSRKERRKNQEDVEIVVYLN